MYTGHKRKEVAAGWSWRRLHNEELHNLYTSLNIINVVKSRVRWAGQVARMGYMRNAYSALVGKPEGKRPVGRHRRGKEDNIRMDVRKIGFEGVDWMHLAPDKDQWLALVNTIMNLRGV